MTLSAHPAVILLTLVLSFGLGGAASSVKPVAVKPVAVSGTTSETLVVTPVAVKPVELVAVGPVKPVVAAPAVVGPPAVKTDPVLVQTGGPGEPVVAEPLAVKTDPVYMGGTLDPGIPTSGPALVGTYVGTGSVRYIPAFQYQLTSGDPQASYNCSAYAMGMAIGKATYGGSQVTGRQIRVLSGVPNYSGMSIPDIMVASDKLHVPIFNMSGRPWADVMAALRAGRGVILQGLYSAIPDRYSGQLGFKGAHAIFIDHLSSTGRLYMMDPLQKVGARWMDESIMRAFADALAAREGVTGVYYAVTPHTRLFQPLSFQSLP